MMDDTLVLDRPVKRKKAKRAGKVRTTLRVVRGGLWVGDILLDRKDRVWRHVDSVPADIVLKAMAAATRGESAGELLGRRDGLTYAWHVVTEPESASESQVVPELAEAA